MSKDQCNKNVLHVEDDDDAMLIEGANTVEHHVLTKNNWVVV